MKKLLLLLLCVPLIGFGQQQTYVPDDNFEQALINLGYDNVLNNYVTTANINTVTFLDVSNQNISDLTGIEDFTALTILRCSNNQLTSLDVSQNTALTEFVCGSNQLTTLDVSQNTALLIFICYFNQLTSLDVSNNPYIVELYCGANQLTSIDIVSVDELYCSSNNLTFIDLTSTGTWPLAGFTALNNPLVCVLVQDTLLWNIWYPVGVDIPSTASYNLPVSNISTVTACFSYQWPINGQIYDSSGTFTVEIFSGNGCLNTEILHLTIDTTAYPTSSTTSVTECDSYTWNGTPYTSSGNYTYLTTNAAGCDSTATLNLTINNSTSSTTSVTECDSSYTWSVNGVTYTASVIDTVIGVNAVGCTETNILNLTINSSSTSTITFTECDSYTWNGTTYTTSGTYIYQTMNSLGCDSTSTLNLTINNSTTSTTSVTECDSYTWNGTPYTSSGNYTYLTANAAGCDSTATLNLTINNSTTSTISVTECDSYMWPENGVTYTASVIDTVIDVNASGCTETNILNLIINNAPTSSSVLGNTQVSYLSTETYNIAQNIGSIFSWNLDSGGIIINGQTTNSIEVQWGSTSGTYELYVIESDINGCVGDTVFLSVNVSNSTNIEDLNIDKLTLYPNPSQDVFNIEFISLVRQDLELRIINSIGEIVYIDNVNNHIGAYSNSISLEQYSKAIYFLEIQTDDGIVNKKLILQ